MWNRHRIARQGLAILVAPALIAVVGCSDDGIGKRYPVTGSVSYNGKPVAKAGIALVPKGSNSGGQGANGTVENGQIVSVTTLNPGDGALPGEYVVTVTARDVDTAKAQAEGNEAAQKHGMGKMAMVPPEMLAKAGNAAKSTLPTKYESPATSTLNVTIKEEKNSLDLKLTD